MRLKGTYDSEQVHREWESVYRKNPHQHRFNKLLMKRILAAVRPGPKDMVLDAGCGTGDHTIRLAKEGYSCVGIDLSESVLRRAKANIAQENLGDRIALTCQSLEDLALSEASFDFIHCRGVLMHVPDWQKSVASLCRALKRGGRLAILESNHRSLETQIVLLVRKLMKRESRMSKTPGGLEFWSQQADGQPFLVRIADLGALTKAAASNGFVLRKKCASEFWDINRFPQGIPRTMVIWFNITYLALRLPAFASVGNLLVFEKLDSN